MQVEQLNEEGWVRTYLVFCWGSSKAVLSIQFGIISSRICHHQIIGDLNWGLLLGPKHMLNTSVLDANELVKSV